MLQTNTFNCKTNDFRVKYKTQKCRYLVEKGYCPFKQHCTFAHCEQEVREKMHLSLKYKTKVCHNFSVKGFCTYGSRCHYLHICNKETENNQDGLKTRSNSQESDCSKSSRSERTNKFWSRMTHNKRIELIQSLGFDYSIRSSSRLLQLLNSNQQEQRGQDWMFEEVVRPVTPSLKKYSL